MKALEGVYLARSDLEAQSGFNGGRDRWVAERSPITNAIHRDGSFLDVGCANGLLAADVVDWSKEKGFDIEPYGIDLGPGLVELAREQLQGHASNFTVGDAWSWEPKRRWMFVYSLLELSPLDMWCTWLRRLESWVEPGGRLIVGSYGSSSRGVPATDVASVFRECGFKVTGQALGGNPKNSLFAWADVK